MSDCLRCVNSACCKLEVDVSKKEYDELSKNIKDKFVLSSEAFITEFPIWKNRKNHIDKNLKSTYATIKKMKDGYCYFLNRASMKCSIYEIKPKSCSNYTNNRCKNIRHICTN